MSTATPKLGLIKPARESFSRATWNANLDTIDTDSINKAKWRHFEATRDNQNDNPVATLWGPGGIHGLRDATSSFNDEFAEAGTSGTDGLRLAEEGIYTITWMIGNAGIDTATLWHIICADGTDATTANNTVYGRVPIFGIPVGDWYCCYARNFYIGSSGSNVYFKFSATAASLNLNHQIRVTKIQ